MPLRRGLWYALPTMSVRVRLLLVAVISLLGVAWPAQAARAADKATAEALFQKGKVLMDAGHVDAACPKFQASYEADPAIGALLNLALCHQKQGKTASAWAEFVEAAVLAKRAGDDARRQGAERHARALEPKLSRLTIIATDPTPGLAVSRNGTPLAEGSLGTALPVDPGEHQLVAEAAGYESWSTSITIEPNGNRQTVRIPALAEASAGQDDAGGPAPDEDGSSTTGAQSVAGWVLTGVGAASLVVAAVLGGVASVEVDEAREDPTLCQDDLCTPKGWNQVDAAEAKAHGSTAMFVIGGASIVSGVVLLLTAQGEDEDEPADDVAMLSAEVGPAGVGLTFRDRF